MSRWRIGLVTGWLAVAGAARAEDPPAPEPAAHEDEGALERMWRRVREQRVPVIRADGTRATPILGAAGAALAIGGVVLAVGGVGAILMWRSAAEADGGG